MRAAFKVKHIGPLSLSPIIPVCPLLSPLARENAMNGRVDAFKVKGFYG